MLNKYRFEIHTISGPIIGDFTAKSEDTLEDVRRKAHIFILKKLGRKWNPFLNFTMKIIVNEAYSGRPTTELIINPNSPISKYQVKSIWYTVPNDLIKISVFR